MLRLLMKLAAAAVVVFGLWSASTLPQLGVVVGWPLLIYVIVRAVPAIRADLSRLVGGRLGRYLPDRPAHSANDWRF